MDTHRSEKIHDVFLSFRGPDTRMSFTSHLHSALSRAGIQTFIDDEIDKGDLIAKSLLKAIELSRSSIIIFSENYANSRWCLNEVVKIMECCKTMDHWTMPVFYGVDPSDVRHQKGRFGVLFEDLMRIASVTKETERRYRESLTQTANLSGWHLANYMKENELIEDIVEEVTRKINSTNLFVADYPVGVGPLVQEVISKLQSIPRSNAVHILGLWGMGGIGKTTIAKAIFNALSWQFERRSFITNIREVWRFHKGQDLQEQLLYDILGGTIMKIHSIDMGKEIVKRRLRDIKALVLLDDVNDQDQLKALCADRNCFAPSSIIIITTRDMAILDYLEPDYVHKMKEMENYKSLDLFSWHAFRQPSPTKEYAKLSSNVVAYCGGLPLALEVLGSFLFRRPIPEWEDVLSKLKEIPDDKVNDKLKISYDGLSDDTEKDIFLDICCFFIGKNKNYVSTILNGCGMHSEIGISILSERSLVRVNRNNKLEMHDLIRDMGREIIRKKSQGKLGERSRLWFHVDARKVLEEKMGTIQVEGLALKLPRTDKFCLHTEDFEQMKKLRLLQLSHVEPAANYELPERLRWVCWLEFPWRCPPRNFYRGSLVAIDFRCSNLAVFWKVPQFLHELKILNLSHSHYLIRTPDFSYMPNLERLILKDCPSLSKVDKTIGNLSNLHLVNLKGCECLGHLPRSFYRLRSLENLILSGCSKINKLEEDIEQMESLTTLVADGTAITKAPYSIVRLKSIKYISLCGYEGLSHEVFPSLISSWMSPLNYPRSLSQAFGYMPYQLAVDVQSNVLATKCLEMEASPSTSQISDKEASELSVSHNLIPNSSRSENVLISLVIGNRKILQGWTTDQSADSSFPDDKHPEWPRYSYEGQRVSFKMPHIGRNLEGMILCIDYSCSQIGMTSPFPFCVLIHNNTKGVIKFFKRDAETITDEEEQWQDIAANLEAGDEVDITAVFGHGFNVKKTTVRLVYGDSMEGQQLFTLDRDVVVSCEELKNDCQTLVKINSINGHMHDVEKEDFILSMKKTFKKRFCCFSSGFCGRGYLRASRPSND